MTPTNLGTVRTSTHADRLDAPVALPLLYPVALNVEGHPCLVVGGGRVATRKVTSLLDCGAVVMVVAPAVTPELAKLGELALTSDPPATPRPVRLARRQYQPGEAALYHLVVTATGNPGVDRRVAADAAAAGVWVNCADDAERCGFVVPAVHRDGPVTIAVSTGGASPALATWLRRRIATSVGSRLGDLATLLDEARQDLWALGRSTDSVDWQALLDGPLPDLVEEGRLDEARALLGRATALSKVGGSRQGSRLGDHQHERGDEHHGQDR